MKNEQQRRESFAESEAYDEDMIIFFVYLVGVVMMFIANAYIDAKGAALFDMKPLKHKMCDTDNRFLFSVTSTLFWPLLVPLCICGSFAIAIRRRLITLFENVPQPVRQWRCEELDEGKGYRDGNGRCRFEETCRKQPYCPKHKTKMISL